MGSCTSCTGSTSTKSRIDSASQAVVRPPSEKISTIAVPSNHIPRKLTDQSRSDITCPHCYHSITEKRDAVRSFDASLKKLFPGTYELGEFVFLTKQTLVPKGFYPHVNTLVCVGLCRDEITSPFEEEVEAMWGQAFICGSLGGMLFCGNTGFAAAHHHAPSSGYFIYYCFTHIAIDQEGNVGAVYRTRSGMEEKTTACGALAAFTAEIASGNLNLEFDEDDIEMSMLKKHIAQKTTLSVDPNNPPDLFQVTMAAYETITIDLERQVRNDADKFKERKYAVFTGVQIHGPEGSDYCWLGKSSLYIKGEFLPLALSKNTASLSLAGPSTASH